MLSSSSTIRMWACSRHFAESLQIIFEDDPSRDHRHHRLALDLHADKGRVPAAGLEKGTLDVNSIAGSIIVMSAGFPAFKPQGTPKIRAGWWTSGRSAIERKRSVFYKLETRGQRRLQPMIPFGAFSRPAAFSSGVWGRGRWRCSRWFRPPIPAGSPVGPPRAQGRFILASAPCSRTASSVNRK